MSVKTLLYDYNSYAFVLLVFSNYDIACVVFEVSLNKSVLVEISSLSCVQYVHFIVFVSLFHYVMF